MDEVRVPQQPAAQSVELWLTSAATGADGLLMTGPRADMERERDRLGAAGRDAWIKGDEQQPAAQPDECGLPSMPAPDAGDDAYKYDTVRRLLKEAYRGGFTDAQQPAAQPQCAMRHAPVWKTGANGLPYQESNFQCEVCGYRGKHDAHTGCKRPKPASAEPVAWATPHTINWACRVSECIVKLTRNAQPEHGYTVPLYTRPQIDTREVLRLADEYADCHASAEGDQGFAMERKRRDKARAALCRALGVKK